ncbi:hypothetical protein [Celeribacter persicus]|uniref:Uncharacterized protein n=1 Tax=Celeribacter persicus TaxID=1651082 RepID=A0A2T5HBI8_9RHOB|nr:hypothetical protein [Celeribacter persicus]PTQ68937.1 hypothetical protein C8N42_11380 [Celeribacter persicus]
MTRPHFFPLNLATTIALSLVPLSASANSGLGFTGAQSSIGYLSRDGVALATADGNLDYSISRHHGLQLDLGTISFPDHYQGTLAGHLYMQPNADAKYGFFAAYTDLNDDAAYIGSLGVEGLWTFGKRTLLSLRAGIGLYEPQNRDFLFGDLELKTALSEQLALSANLSAYDLEEADLFSRDITASLGAT